MAYHLEVTANDEADLRAKIATAVTSGQTVLVPSGTYELTAPIVVAQQSSFHLIGSGVGGPGAEGGGKTVIKPAAGSLAAFANKPVIELRGVTGAKIEKVRIENASQATTPGVTINSLEGWASTGIEFNLVYFNCPGSFGVRTNSNAVDLTNSEISFERCFFIGSLGGLLIANGQALNFYLNRCHFDQLDYGVLVSAGGNVTIDGGATNSVDSLLHLASTAGGNNASQFVIRSVRMEYSGNVYRYSAWVTSSSIGDGASVIVRMDGNSEAGTTIDTNKSLNSTYPAMINLSGDIRAFVTGHMHRDRPYVSLAGNARYFDDGSTWWYPAATSDYYTGDYKRIAIKHPFGGFSNPHNEFTVLARGTNLQDFKAL